MAPQQSQRRRREKRDMDVKVLYTLESSPNSTMVAHVGRPMPIELLPALRGSSSSRPTIGKSASQSVSSSHFPTPRFGTVTLKTCLSAICIASPELIFDDRKDHILYSVDPLETHRNVSQRSVPHSSAPKDSSSSRNQQSNSRQHANLAPGHNDPGVSSVLVGKGFFSWALAEAGDGVSMVTGVVRGTSSEHEDDDEFDDEELEVVLRLKETPRQSKEQYFHLVKAFNSVHGEANQSTRKRRAEEVPAEAPPSQRQRQVSSGATQQGVEAAAPVASTSQDRLPLPKRDERNIYDRFGAVTPTLQPLHAVVPASSVAPPLMQNPAALQLLQMLQQLQAQQAGTSPAPVSTPNAAATPTPSEQQTAQLMAFLGPLVGSSSATSLASLPAAPTADGPEAEASSNVGSPAAALQPQDAALADRQTKCCYNCGVRGLAKWTYSELPNGEADVRYRDGSDAPHRAHKSAAQQWRACIPCGKYLRTHCDNRPHELFRNRTRPAQVNGSTGKRRNADDESNATTATANATPASELDKQTMDSPAAALGLGARAFGLPRTLSEVCERDVHRLKGSGSLIVDNFENARLKDYVRDQHGNLRTKRSVRDNPSGEGPGRPKGRKTGQRQGRGAERFRLAKNSSISLEEQHAAEVQGRGAASSPGVARAPSGHRSRTQTGKTTREFHAHDAVIQSSPVRPSMASRSAGPWAAPQPQASSRRLSSHLDATTPSFTQSTAPTPSGRSSGQLSSLLQPASSPGTAFRALLGEGDFDWSEIAHAGSRFTQLSPVRRSPRKQPHGTRARLNPYASTQVSQAPDAHQALWTSSDAPEGRSARRRDGAPGACSSSVTTPDSPCSPSPARARQQQSKQPQQSSHTVSLEQLRLGESWTSQAASNLGSAVECPGSPSQGRKAARQARAAAAAGPSAAPVVIAPQFGPFMGLKDIMHADLSDHDNALGNTSPTLGRTRRRKADGYDVVSLGQGAGSSAGNFAKSSSPVAFPDAEGIEAFDEWGRTPSTRAFFPTPSPVKAWSPSREHDSPSVSTSGSGRRISPRRKEAADLTPQALHDAMPPPSIVDPLMGSKPSPAAASLNARAPAAVNQHVARRPLPATVEDAPSTSAASSPPDAISPEDYMDTAEVFAQFEDPGGLLAAHGIGVDGNGISADMLSGVELHSMLDFGQHLRQFSQERATGVAAALLPGGLAAAASNQHNTVSGNSETANASANSPSTPSKKSRAVAAAQTTPRARTRSQANAVPDTASPFTAFMTALSHVRPNGTSTPSRNDGESAPQLQFAMPSLTSPSFNFPHGDAQHSGLDFNALIANINEQQQLDRNSSFAALLAPESDDSSPAS